MAVFHYVDSSFTTPLLRAIFNCKKEELCEALNQGFSCNLQDNRGWTPVHEAAIIDGRSDCLRELINFSSDSINNQTFLGETPLFLACERNCIKAVKVLLNKPNCNVNLANSEGVSPLHIASNKGHLKIVKMIIEHGAEVNSQDYNGYTALHEAVSSGNSTRGCQDEVNFKICQYLLSHGANPNVREFEGNLPFHLSCQSGFLKCINLFYQKSKMEVINMKNDDGRTPLMMGVQSKNPTVVKTLLAFGADPNTADQAGITSLHLAAHSACFEIFEIILTATKSECILKYCVFDEERDFDNFLENKRIISVICLAIDTEDLIFLNKVLDSNVDPAVLQCPIVHTENLVKKTYTLHSPVSFLLENKMFDLGERTMEFLQSLIDHNSPLKIISKKQPINYANPVCACLVALNDCPKEVVMGCLKLLLRNGADPDEPYDRMSFAIEQACMRGCVEAVMLLLQYSSIWEPEDILHWIEVEASSHQEAIVNALIPLAPYFRPSSRLLHHICVSQTNILCRPKVYSLASYCRNIIRKQLHKITQPVTNSMRQNLQELELPKNLYHYLCYEL